MNSKDVLATNDRFSKWKLSLDYSRHLCIKTRPSALLGNTSFKPFDDAGQAKCFGKTHYGSFDDGKKSKTRSMRPGNDNRDLNQTQARKANQRFQRKLGKENMRRAHDFSLNLRAHTGRKPCPMPSDGGGEDGSGEDVYRADEDDARSFCDSVSSIACSSMMDEDKPEKWIKDVPGSVDKLTKFNAIENWLKNVRKQF